MRLLKHFGLASFLIISCSAGIYAQQSFADKKTSISTNVAWDANGFYNLTLARRFDEGRHELQVNVGIASGDDESEAWVGGDSGYSYLWDGGNGLFLTYRRYMLRKSRGLFVQAQAKFFAPDWSYKENSGTTWTAVDNDMIFNPSAHVGFKWNIGKGRVFIAPFVGVNFNRGDFVSPTGVVLRDEDGDIFGSSGASPDIGLNIGLNF